MIQWYHHRYKFTLIANGFALTLYIHLLKKNSKKNYWLNVVLQLC